VNFDGGVGVTDTVVFNAYKSMVSPQRLIAIHVL
jgi:hypothetical protein